jgi:hypothetical protein
LLALRRKDAIGGAGALDLLQRHDRGVHPAHVGAKELVIGFGSRSTAATTSLCKMLQVSRGDSDGM